MSNREDLIERALRYVAQEHNTAVMHRDEMYGCRKREVNNGMIANALAYEIEIAKLEGKIDGLATATVQLQMVRDNERIDT